MNVLEWVERNWRVPETGQLIVLRDWQRAALTAMFPLDGSPSRWETFSDQHGQEGREDRARRIATMYRDGHNQGRACVCDRKRPGAGAG